MPLLASSILVACLLAERSDPQGLARPASSAMAGLPSSAKLSDLTDQIATVLPRQANFDLWVPDKIWVERGIYPNDVASSLFVDLLLDKGLVLQGYTRGEGGRTYHFHAGPPADDSGMVQKPESDLDFIMRSTSTYLWIVFSIIGVGSAIQTVRMRRRAAREEARGGCVACGSMKVRIEGDAAICEQCNYTGRTDRGGALLQNGVAVAHQAAARPDSGDPKVV